MALSRAQDFAIASLYIPGPEQLAHLCGPRFRIMRLKTRENGYKPTYSQLSSWFHWIAAEFLNGMKCEWHENGREELESGECWWNENGETGELRKTTTSIPLPSNPQA